MIRPMNLVSVEGASKALGDEPLFEGVTLGIDEGDRIGFIGPNGCGKSTFLRVLAGRTSPDEGRVSINRGLRVAYLEQLPLLPDDSTIASCLYDGAAPALQLVKDYHDAVEAADNDRIHELGRRIEQEDGWRVENTYHSFLTELGIEGLDRRLAELSGGMAKKVALARALATRAPLLLLDEPTNHLDIDAIEWLERYLGETTQAFVLVTHDRYLLDGVCRTVLEVDNRSIYKYPGNYATYVVRRSRRQKTLQQQQERIETVLRRELEWLRRGPKARTGKDKSRKIQIQNLMDGRVGEEPQMSEFSSSHRRHGKKILELHHVEKSYGDLAVIRPFSYTFKRGERIGVVGPNGSGKTTLLDIVVGRLEPDAGVRDPGINTVFSYYDQLSRTMDTRKTILEYITEHAEEIRRGDGSSVAAGPMLERFLFPSQTHRLPIKHLSGGERRRLYLVRILLENPNFLVLDEPTNDLDIDTLTLLEDYVGEFSGCVLIASHDRAFLDRTTDYLFLCDGSGRIRGFAGDYSSYREALRQETSGRTQNRRQSTAALSAGKPGTGPSFRAKREMESLMEEIDRLEEEKAALDGYFSSGTTDPSELGAKSLRYKQLEGLIESRTLRWEELGEGG
jgi:ATP-binding cassette subfamily F protein uup